MKPMSGKLHNIKNPRKPKSKTNSSHHSNTKSSKTKLKKKKSKKMKGVLTFASPGLKVLREERNEGGGRETQRKNE